MDRSCRGVGRFGTALLLCSLIVTTLAAPASAAPVRGDLIVADARALGGGALIAVDPATGAQSLLSSNTMPVNVSAQLFNLPFTLTTNEAGEIFVANTANLGGSCKNGCGGVIKVNPETGAESVLSSNAMPVNASNQYFGELTGITIDPQGNILVTSWGGTLGHADVVRVDPTTGKETLVSSNAMPVNASSELFAYPQGLITNAAGEIFVADPLAFGEHGGGIIGVNPVTGKESEVSTNAMPVNSTRQYFHDPSQLAFNTAGNLLVDDWCPWNQSCGGIVEVEPQTGGETDISSNALPVNAMSEYFSESTAAAIAENGDIIEVQQTGLGGSCEHGCGGLVSVDPATGKETVLSANSLTVNGHSELFTEPFDVAVYGYTPSPSPQGAIGGDAVQPSSGAPSGSPLPTPSRGLLIHGVAQSRRLWHEPTRHRSRSRPSRATGTVFSFTLDQPAQVEIEFARIAHGHRVHGICRTADRNNHRHSCTLRSPVGVLVVTGQTGANTVPFNGLISGRRPLAPGNYLVTVRAVDGAERVVGVPALRFRITS